MHAAPLFRRYALRALLLLAATLPIAACSVDDESPARRSTGVDKSNAEPVLTGAVPPEVADVIDRVLSQPRYARSSWGLSVRELSMGDALLDQQSEKMFVTGSILKTFTAATVLDSYGPDYRFRTPVYRTAVPRQGRCEWGR